MFTGVLLLIIMIGTSGLAWRGSQGAAVILVLESILWLVMDRRFEGPVLFEVRPGNGLVLADLVGLAGIALATLTWWKGTLLRSNERL